MLLCVLKLFAFSSCNGAFHRQNVVGHLVSWLGKNVFKSWLLTNKHQQTEPTGKLLTSQGTTIKLATAFSSTSYMVITSLKRLLSSEDLLSLPVIHSLSLQPQRYSIPFQHSLAAFSSNHLEVRKASALDSDRHLQTLLAPT